MKFQRPKREITALLMLVWLFAWIGMALAHEVSHLVHFGEKSNIVCAVCRALEQPAPADMSALSALTLPGYSAVIYLRPVSAQLFLREKIALFIPRGPPALLF